MYQFEISANVIEKRRNTVNALCELFGSECFTRKEFEKAFTHKNRWDYGCVPSDGMIRLDDLRKQGLIVVDHTETFPIILDKGDYFDDYVFKNGKTMPYNTDKEAIEALEKVWGKAVHANWVLGQRHYYRVADNCKTKLCAKEKRLYEEIEMERRALVREIEQKQARLDAMKQTMADLAEYRF